MNNWWKDPRLDDEGTYDYLAEELPDNYVKWYNYPCKCDDCGKTRRWHKSYVHHFYCWDGWDSMDYSVCWKCEFSNAVHHSLSKAKKNIQHILKVRHFDIGSYIVFIKYCKAKSISKEHRSYLWNTYYDTLWSNKENHKFLKGVK